MGSEDLGPLPVIHEREAMVREAENKMLTHWIEVSKDLTEGEEIRVLTNFLSGRLGTIAKFMIRAERHPDDPDQPGGLA